VLPDDLGEAGGTLCQTMQMMVAVHDIKVGDTVVFTIPSPVIKMVTDYYTACRSLVSTTVNKNAVKTIAMIKPDKKVAQQWCGQVCELASAMDAQAPAAEKKFWQWCGEKARLDHNKQGGAADNSVVSTMAVADIANKYGGYCNEKRVEYRGGYATMIRACAPCVTLAALQNTKKRRR